MAKCDPHTALVPIALSQALALYRNAPSAKVVGHRASGRASGSEEPCSRGRPSCSASVLGHKQESYEGRRWEGLSRRVVARNPDAVYARERTYPAIVKSVEELWWFRGVNGKTGGGGVGRCEA